MFLYKYLDEPEHVEAWINGGRIPLKPASFYRRVEREGIYTPDEVLELDTEGIPSYWDETNPGQLILGQNLIGVNTSAATPGSPHLPGEIRLKNVNLGGTLIADSSIRTNARDSLILCLTSDSRARREVAKKFGSKRYAVRITGFERLKHSISEQLGLRPHYSLVRYTKSADRNSFLKSLADSWQREFRIAWFDTTVDETWVSLPFGVAEAVPLE